MRNLLLIFLLVSPGWGYEPVCSTLDGPVEPSATFENTAASVPVHFGAFKVEVNSHATGKLKYRLVSTVSIDRITAQWFGYEADNPLVMFGKRDYQVEFRPVVPITVEPNITDAYLEMNGEMYFDGNGQLTLQVARAEKGSQLLAGTILCVTEFAD